MPWSSWYECRFDSKGELDMQPLKKNASSSTGIYAIATKFGSGYSTKYIGRSGKDIYRRLYNHFTGRGNKIIAGILRNKKERPSDPTQALYFAFLETKEHKLIEAAYIDGKNVDKPIGNLIRARLPEGLREEDIFNSELED
jgi:hypothetical protein